MCVVAGLSQAVKLPNPKAFEATVTYAQLLTQWCLLVLGGSVAILVGTSYHAPRHWFFRYSYILFLFGWLFLGLSMWFGAGVNRVYLAYLWNAPSDPEAYISSIDTQAFRQLCAMEWALGILVAWLVIYLLWWVRFRPQEQLNATREG